MQQHSGTISHAIIRVYGRVQGVFYRHNAKKIAEMYTINGLIRNEPDGSVYIEAEGEKDDLRRFIEWCRRGSKGAHIERVEVTEGPVRHFSDFIIEPL